MVRSLHVLKMVIPGPASTALSAPHDGILSPKVSWPCGCTAIGPDDEALVVKCCNVHVALLSEGTSMFGRSNM